MDLNSFISSQDTDNLVNNLENTSDEFSGNEPRDRNNQISFPSKGERLRRQAFAESRLDPNAKSPKGALGPLQIMPNTYMDYMNATGDNTPYKNVKNFSQAIKVRNWIMDDISNASFIGDKDQDPNVKLAKVYAAYNMGRGNLLEYLNNAKQNGEDIYHSLNWINGLSDETRGYLNRILLKGDPKFEQDYNNAKNNPNMKYFKKYDVGGLIEKLSSGSKVEKVEKVEKVIPTNNLRTFDFGEWAGKKQTNERNKKIHETIIMNPELPMADEGESWNEASKRVIDIMNEIIKTAPEHTTIVTHNSVFGLIYLWDKLGRPNKLNQEQRKKYTEQDGDFDTGDHCLIVGKNGTIYVVRHGETYDNAKGNFRYDNVKLTEKGKKQAVEVGEKLKGVEIPQVITSSLKRAVDTSHIILEQQEEKKKEKFKKGGIPATPSKIPNNETYTGDQGDPPPSKVARKQASEYRQFEKNIIKSNMIKRSRVVKRQSGGHLWAENKPMYADSILRTNINDPNKEWIQRLYNQNAPTLKTNTIKGYENTPDNQYSTHLMGDDGNGYVYPLINMVDGKLMYTGDKDNEDVGYNYAKTHNIGIQLPKEQGTWFANNGYKIAPGVMNNIKNGKPENNSDYKIEVKKQGGTMNWLNKNKNKSKKYQVGGIMQGQQGQNQMQGQDKNKYANTLVVKPNYLGVPAPMYEFASNALPHSATKADSTEYNNNLKMIAGSQNPMAYDPDKLKDKMIEIAGEDINMRPEESRRRDYIKLANLHGAAIDYREQKQNFDQSIKQTQMGAIQDIINKFL